MAKLADSGRARYRDSARGRRRGGHPSKRKLEPVEFGRERFRVSARRPRGNIKRVQLAPLNLDPLVSEVTWRRQGSHRTGEMTLNVPGKRRGIPGLLAKGDIVRLEISARAGAPWRVLWEMEVTTAKPTLSSGTLDVAMRSRLNVAQKSRKHWRFRKDKKHPHGWTATEIAIAACDRFHVPKGQIARTGHRIPKLIDKAGSVVEVVTQAFAEVRKFTGHRFDISIDRGRLDVKELRRPAYMLVIGPQIIDAVLDDTLPKGYATAIVLTSTVKVKGKKKRRKLRVKVVDRQRLRQHGYIVRHVHVSDITSKERLRRHGLRLLARHPTPFSTATVTLPGIPWADRGDGLDAKIPEFGVSATIYTTGVEHRLSYGSYEMDVTVAIEDPWTKDERAARVARKKAAVRRRRRRRGHTHAPRRKSKKARVRG